MHKTVTILTILWYCIRYKGKITLIITTNLFNVSSKRDSVNDDFTENANKYDICSNNREVDKSTYHDNNDNNKKNGKKKQYY